MYSGNRLGNRSGLSKATIANSERTGPAESHRSIPECLPCRVARHNHVISKREVSPSDFPRVLERYRLRHGPTIAIRCSLAKPTDNPFIEAFNSHFRAECLNQHWFPDLEDATMKINDWRQDYNQIRPHGAIGNRVPMDLLKTDRSARANRSKITGSLTSQVVPSLG